MEYRTTLQTMCDVTSRGEQARRERRLATKHEQSETHNENDDRRDAATRRYQEPPTKWNVRLLIASINVTSAVSGSGAAREHAYETGGLNMTGRMAELDYLLFDVLTSISSGYKRADYRKHRFCRRMDTQSSTLERCQASITTVCSCGSRNITQKP